MSKYEPCSICEEFIEGVICDKDKCPVGIMKKENERLQMLQKPTEASGYKIENGKVVFYTNILNGYRHEYANLDEVVQDLNLMCPKGFYCMRNASNKCPRLNFQNNKPYCEVFYPFLETDSSGNVLKDERCLLAERKARLAE